MLFQKTQAGGMPGYPETMWQHIEDKIIESALDIMHECYKVWQRVTEHMHKATLGFHQHPLTFQATCLWSSFSILSMGSPFILTFRLFRLPPATPK